MCIRDSATIVRDLDFTLDLEAVAFPEFSVEAATDTFGKYALTAHLARFLALIGETPQEAEPVAIEPGPLKKDQAALDLLDQALSQGEMLGIAYSLGAQASLFESSATVAFSSSEGVEMCIRDRFKASVRVKPEGRGSKVTKGSQHLNGSR